jgi:hypothetical protein
VALAPRDARALATLVSDLRELHGDSLRAVLLAGEAAGPEYQPGRSALGVVAVLARLDAALLRRTRPRIAAWRRRRIPPPLLLEEASIARSLDVFPLELLELRDRHQVLYGNAGAIERIEVEATALRLELEEQLHGKVIHLMTAYLDTRDSTRALRRLLLDSPPGFAVLLRGILHLHGGRDAERPADPQHVIAAVESALGIPLPALRRLDRVRRGQEPLARGELEGVFEAYLEEVRRLEQRVDAW